ncbi:hypothetical protein [Alkaliphilus metalliredigens]|nr:hypothetical protein [Alkaliphilus metalliredigens]
MNTQIKKKGNQSAKILSLLIFFLVLTTTLVYYLIYNNTLQARGYAMEGAIHTEQVTLLFLIFILFHLLFLPLASLQNRLCKTNGNSQAIKTDSNDFLKSNDKICDVHSPCKQEV